MLVLIALLSACAARPVAPAVASPPPAPATSSGTPQSAPATAPANAKTAAVFGTVMSERGVPVANAGVVGIRSLTTGVVAVKTEVDSLGQFAVKGIAPGTYVVELFIHGTSPQIAAISTAFTVAAGEVIQTVLVGDRSVPSAIKNAPRCRWWAFWRCF